MSTRASLIIEKMVRKVAIKAIEDTLPELLLDIQMKSPVDTGTFLSQNRIKGVRIEGNKVIGSVINEGEYSEKVEFGWRKTPVNWHMHDGTIFHSKGAETFQRALLKIKPNLFKRLGA